MANPPLSRSSSRPPKLLDRVREAIRVRHYSVRTERVYVHWIKRYIFFHKVRHPVEMGAEEVRSFLSHLAVDQGLSASSQNQALNALVFLYKLVLEKDVGWVEGIVRAKRPTRMPVVLTHDEVGRLLAQLDGRVALIGRLLYGSGLRLLECLQMRVKDIDFERNEITVRDGKGRKDRMTVLPAACKPALQTHLEAVRSLHNQDLARGLGRAPMPDALARKYPAPTPDGLGSGSSQRHHTTPTAARESATGTTCTKPWFSGPWARPSAGPASPSRPRHIPSDIPSPPS